MAKKHRVGDLQLAILRRLWRRGEASAAEVHADLLADRGLAPTTIATMLKKMEAKGVVRHRSAGRKYLYRATVSEREVATTMVGEIRDRLFEGDTVALVSHLLREHEVDAREIEELKALIEGARGRRTSDARPDHDLRGASLRRRQLDPLVRWLATYAFHSTLLLGSAWLLAPALPAVAERLWRFALFGSLATATAHAGGFLPSGGHVAVGLPAAHVAAAAPAPARRSWPTPTDLRATAVKRRSRARPNASRSVPRRRPRRRRRRGRAPACSRPRRHHRARRRRRRRATGSRRGSPVARRDRGLAPRCGGFDVHAGLPHHPFSVEPARPPVAAQRRGAAAPGRVSATRRVPPAGAADPGGGGTGADGARLATPRDLPAPAGRDRARDRGAGGGARPRAGAPRAPGPGVARAGAVGGGHAPVPAAQWRRLPHAGRRSRAAL